jgi:hypothetical protein
LVGILVCARLSFGAGGARRELSQASNPGLHGAAEAVGVAEQRGLGRWCGFNLRRPESRREPQCRDRNQSHPWSPENSEQGEGYDGGDRRDEQDRRARAHGTLGREFGDRISEGEAERSRKQGNSAELEGFDPAGFGPKTALALGERLGSGAIRRARTQFRSGNTRGLPQQAPVSPHHCDTFERARCKNPQRVNMTTVSMCVVWGNRSMRWISETVYPEAVSVARSAGSVCGEQET